MCASGGYYAAAATDRIYVNESSLVGSIGVLIDGFGFADALDKLGIQRRLITAGEHKGFLDPFSPLEPEDRAHAERKLEKVHRQFVEAVKAGRGERLKPSPGLFSGRAWTGATSVEMGLADAFGNTPSVARDVIKAEDIVDFTLEQTLAEKLARRVGTAFSHVLVEAGVGGTVVRNPGTFDAVKQGPDGQTLHGDHAHVFHQVPVNARKRPLVFWHGFGQFSKTWETTPDGREGFPTLCTSALHEMSALLCQTFSTDAQPRRAGL